MVLAQLALPPSSPANDTTYPRAALTAVYRLLTSLRMVDVRQVCDVEREALQLAMELDLVTSDGMSVRTDEDSSDRFWPVWFACGYGPKRKHVRS